LTTLAFDTATPAPSLAVLRDGALLLERTLAPEPGAGRRVAEEIHLLLRAAAVEVGELDEIVVGVGPGGFTGLRIGIATALGLGQALAIPVAGVVSLEALALGMADHAPLGVVLVPVIDAKRQEVFAAGYRPDGAGGLDTVIEPVAATAAGLAEMLRTVATPKRPAWLAGDGTPRCESLLDDAVVAAPPGSPAHAISASRLVSRVAGGGWRPVVPLYLRLPDAEVNRLRREREAARA
jgi:tRNA threonylcarbamoyladenosine biosynthesis protein TsaB